MELDQRVDVLEDKVEDLRVEHAETRTIAMNTAKNLDKLTGLVLAEQQMFKLVTSFLLKNSHIIGGCLAGLGCGAYYAGAHHLIF